jgi:molybdopterin molybdotransferase
LFNFIEGGILRDKDEHFFKKQIEKNIKSKIDIIITSGAVSAGKHDFIPSVVKKFNLSSFFKGVAIRPGKPILFANLKEVEKAFFGFQVILFLLPHVLDFLFIPIF